MRPPRLPPLLREIVQTGILAADGITFTDRTACPACGGSLAPHDVKERKFAVLATGDGERTVSVHVKRFYCRSCHTLSYAEAPFYPETRIGSPVVDLCLGLSMTMPVNRVAAYLEELGVSADRTTCRLYVRSGQDAVATNASCLATNVLFGIHLPVSVISLSDLVSRSGPGKTISGNEILTACGFPSRREIPRNLPCPGKNGEAWRGIDRRGPGARV